MRSRFARFAAILPSAAALGAAATTLAVVAASAVPLHAGGASAQAAPAAGSARGSAAAPAPSSPSAPADAQDRQTKMKAQMDAYMKLAQPGEHHKRLDMMAGKWKTSGKSWMDPTQPPLEFTGTMEASWSLGGRYLQSVHKGSFFGQPFEGRGTDGYDNATHEYFATWIDNMGTGVMVFRGTCEDPCKSLAETAEGFDPMMGKVVKTKAVTTFVDPDTYRFEMYMVGAAPDGKDMKVMEMVGQRVK